MQQKEYMDALISWRGRSHALSRLNHLSPRHPQCYNFIGGFAL
jgi:hypothetical protein